jgi:uncharacterized protein (TIGR00730 family)
MPAKKITVFGGSTPKAGEPAYEFAVRLGCLLAEHGYTVLTGGYIGTMEAVSRGANEAGGHVIGVTCAEIETWRPIKANPWVIEEIRFPTLRQRLYGLIDLCDGAVALPGGIGTLAEIAVLWSQLQTGASHSRPFVLVGKGWRNTMEEFIHQQGEYVPHKYRTLFDYVEDEIAAVNVLDQKIDQ